VELAERADELREDADGAPQLRAPAARPLEQPFVGGGQGGVGRWV